MSSHPRSVSTLPAPPPLAPANAAAEKPLLAASKSDAVISNIPPASPPVAFAWRLECRNRPVAQCSARSSSSSTSAASQPSVAAAATLAASAPILRLRAAPRATKRSRRALSSGEQSPTITSRRPAARTSVLSPSGSLAVASHAMPLGPCAELSMRSARCSATASTPESPSAPCAFTGRSRSRPSSTTSAGEWRSAMRHTCSSTSQMSGAASPTSRWHATTWQCTGASALLASGSFSTRAMASASGDFPLPLAP
mmetsp:Transcript_3130/g.12712  ORF Transcript_3130/g.12712 Transcript_3130/m.12712 type:complete len:254 (+) Transcript_3130:1008-1769(+)